MQLWNWRGLDVINAHERDPRVYVDGHARGGRRPWPRAGSTRAPLYTHRFPLERLGEALELRTRAQGRPDGFREGAGRRRDGR